MFRQQNRIDKWNAYFHCVGSTVFATAMSELLVVDLDTMHEVVLQLPDSEVLAAVGHHGNIGQEPKHLEGIALSEQAKILSSSEASIRADLRALGEQYLAKFGIKFMVFASGRSASEVRVILEERLAKGTLEGEWKIARQVLFDIGVKRLKEHPTLKGLILRDKLESLKEPLSVAVRNGTDAVQTAYSPQLPFPKTDATPFITLVALQVFARHGLSLDLQVNASFASRGSSFCLTGEQANDVTLWHLMRHNSHISDDGVTVEGMPGRGFRYNLKAFEVLIAFVELLEKKSFTDVASPLFAALELTPDLTFDGVRLAAQPADWCKLGAALSTAYSSMDGCRSISQETARVMLFDLDSRSVEVLPQRGCKVGTGIFVFEATFNKFALMATVDDDICSLFLFVYHGSDAGRGFFAQSKSAGSLVSMAHSLLRVFRLQSVMLDKATAPKSSEGSFVDTIRTSVFNMLEPTHAEVIVDKGPRSEWAEENIFADARVVMVSNDRFASAGNLTSPFEPVFEPTWFGRQGKVMDSWESVRHNPQPYDEAVYELRSATPLRYAFLSTKYHTGNAVQAVKVFGASVQQCNDADIIASLFDDRSPGISWNLILPQISMAGHSYRCIDFGTELGPFTHIRIQTFPDGGFTRFGLFSSKSGVEKQTRYPFFSIENSELRKFDEPVPDTTKPLTLTYAPTREEIAYNVQKVAQSGQEVFDVGLQSLGATILSASDEHYSPAIQVIAPFSPLNMFDGLENARSRNPATSYETCEVLLAWQSDVHRLEMDFTFFVNNSPRMVLVDYAKETNSSDWETLMPQRWIKHYYGGHLRFDVPDAPRCAKLRLKVFPCGGMNRLHVFTKTAPPQKL